MRVRSLVIALILILAVFGTRAAVAQDADPAARTAAESWLTLVDDGQYAESWRQAAAAFRAAVTEDTWAQAAGMARTPLGALQTREVRRATPMTSLPGAPDGEYVVLQYTSRFEKKAEAVETITITHEADGQWRTVGYFVR